MHLRSVPFGWANECKSKSLGSFPIRRRHGADVQLADGREGWGAGGVEPS